MIYSLFKRPPRPKLICDEVSMTQQHFRDEADINTIMSRYARTGLLVDPARVSGSMPTFDDFSSLPDYQESQNVIAFANQSFSQLPAVMRKRFNNDPAEMIAFLNDENNRSEAIKLGLVDEPAEPAKLSEQLPT